MALLTWISNDYGYDQWVSKAPEFYADSGDLVILISSSGTSKNIVKAAEYCKIIIISSNWFINCDLNIFFSFPN